ncbi:MAG: cbb3-type cytochrome c oxidase subunit I, partial [Elusimicrobia bacterium]|nr:cbb3-type cytochrome c oxidase subunit I [Elusimicrobiota bacterium]
RGGSPAFAIPAGALKDPAKLRQLCAFFFWTSWASAADRPGGSVSYTNNWPHEPLIGNAPTGQAVVWTGLSVILLLAGIAGMVTFYARRSYAHSPAAPPPAADPFLALPLTPSQKAVPYYFAVVALLLLAQIGVGAVTAHYGVEGNGFYGLPLDRWLPYAVTRTWHIQLGLFWIATAWLASGLFIGPIIAGREPAGQAAGTYALLAALAVIVGGSMAGEWVSVFHKFKGDAWFYWGHQGYEYLDLGRVWQAGLFAGLLLWLALLARCVLPALRKNGEDRHLLGVFLMSTFAIALLYGAGLMWGAHTNLTLAEYWRWWVVHLWVEGFFEVFATVVIAFLFYRMGLVEPGAAARASLLSSTVYLSGGIIGTLHHLYFAGTPAVAMAFGAVFSALEVVPLVLMGYEAWEHVRVGRMAPWVENYKWPIRFFIAVAFWNMVGAGLFGFMINPPIALYYMQGLNTTPVHGHGALFGVYGMLGIGLMLFCLRAIKPEGRWKDGALNAAFWGMNAGLGMMIVLSLLPLGLLQTLASVDTGYWYARSEQFMQVPLMNSLRWLRVPGDTVFAAGVLALALFLGGLVTGHSYARED